MRETFYRRRTNAKNSGARRVLSVFAVLLIFIAAVTAGKAYSAWEYRNVTVGTQKNLSVELAFMAIFSPTPDGERQAALLEKIMNDDVGLNNPNSNLNAGLTTRGSEDGENYIGSDDFNSGSDLKTDFGLTGDTNFIVSAPDDETRYLYSTEVDSGSSTGSFLSASPVWNIPENEYLYIVYRTTLKKNPDSGKWEPKKIETGYAKAAPYTNSKIFGFLPIGRSAASFDPDSWTAGKRGADAATAIYAYAGQTAYAHADSAEEKVYYKTVPTADGKITIEAAVTDPASKITVYSAPECTDGDKVTATDNTTNGTAKVTFTGVKDATYYAVAEGNRDMTITFSAAA